MKPGGSFKSLFRVAGCLRCGGCAQWAAAGAWIVQGVSAQGINERPLPRFEDRTGLDYERLLCLVQAVERRIGSWRPRTRRRKVLDLFDAVIVVLVYLRCNDIEAAVAERTAVSQPTVSRCLTVLEPTVSACLDDLARSKRERAARSDLAVNGFLIPAGDPKGIDGLYSGKRHRGGANAPVITDLQGRPIDAGVVLRGAVHDARAFGDSGLPKAY